MDYISQSPEQTSIIAQKIASRLKGGEVICLYGDLGAGKTVFVKGIIQYYLPEKRVLSPTFIIVRHYQPKKSAIKNIYHLDLYRIQKEAEAAEIGFNDMINSGSLVAIEWADKLGKLLPQKRIDIRINILDDNRRSIKINPWKI